MEQTQYHYYIFHTDTTNVEQKIQNLDCVEDTSVLVTVPISEKMSKLPYSSRSLVSITIYPHSKFKILDSNIDNIFEETWFKQ